VTAVKEQLLEPLTKRDSVDEWHVLAPLARLPGDPLCFSRTSLFCSDASTSSGGGPEQELACDRSIPPVGQRVKNVEEHFQKFVAFAHLHGIEGKLDAAKSTEATLLLVDLHTFWEWPSLPDAAEPLGIVLTIARSTP
jgi:hypothetical protein